MILIRHRKINREKKCICGSKMFYWKDLWICEREIKEKLTELEGLKEFEEKIWGKQGRR